MAVGALCFQEVVSSSAPSREVLSSAVGIFGYVSACSGNMTVSLAVEALCKVGSPVVHLTGVDLQVLD